jgi:outer membrane protein assembly factor BamA
MDDHDFKEEEVRVDTFRSGVGIRSDAAVKVTHLPTGHTVTCNDSPSQHRNRKSALKQLTEKIQRGSYDLHPLRADEEGITETEVRIRRCSEAINAALERFGCRLDISVMVTTRGNIPHLDIVPVESFKGSAGDDP